MGGFTFQIRPSETVPSSEKVTMANFLHWLKGQAFTIITVDVQNQSNLAMLTHFQLLLDNYLQTKHGTMYYWKI